jgi:type I restriction enzyme R subunit
LGCEKTSREQVYFTDGRIYVKGNLTHRGKGKKADYILYYKPNIAIAVIEAKNNSFSVGHGIQQALDYAEVLDLPVAFSSNKYLDTIFTPSDPCTVSLLGLSNR